MQRRELGVVAMVVAVVFGAMWLSGCGGSSGSSSSLPSTSGETGTLEITVEGPGRSVSPTRQSRYGDGAQGRWVPPTTLSVKAWVYPEGDMATVQTNGFANLPGTVVLTNVPAGPKDIRVWAYDGPNATNNIVAFGINQVRILGGRTNSATVPIQAGRLIFTSYRDGNYEIYRVSPDGRYFTRMTSNTFEDFGPAPSPDGSKIAYASNPTGGNYEIRTMTATGGSIATFANPAGDDLGPTWSPDSKTIAWVEHGTDAKYYLWRKNLDGTGTASMNFGTTQIFEPAWSPDGTRIALVYSDGVDYEIALVRSNLSGSPTVLTNDSVHQEYPVWSPDGSAIYCSSVDTYGYAQLATLDGNLWPGMGSASLTLLTDEPWNHWLGGVSPDGQLLACCASNWFTGANSNLFYYSTSGAPLGERGYVRVTYTNAHDQWPSFLPPTTGGGSIGYE